MSLSGLRFAAAFALVLVCPLVSAAAADDVPARLDNARAAYQKGDIARAAREIEAALTQLHDRLGKIFAETLPNLGGQWKAETVETESLGEIGGGLSVSRAFTRGDASLNVSLLLDSPEVASVQAMLSGNSAQPNLKKVKVGGEDALLRFDAATGTGEITMVVGGRVVLEVQGDNINNTDPLLEAAAGWNVGKIKTLLAN
ncbi:hypothetical protein [Magnetospirillum sulfuroxidans]|uniref:Uncharacterized protein n=1 Tax=Magnetospirillum sulfuroxidans TaxID=611300 RepID=A0ABS5ID75_9PROT|nr:hypothetical protein [Magnetospirillum sulfuroxidans]MBR9971678.1 hypothetical protein [Magnetospirillum sulfuroxidans]